MEKLIIYQVFTRLFGANANKNVSNGSKKENGCGKMADIVSEAFAKEKVLKKARKREKKSKQQAE